MINTADVNIDEQTIKKLGLKVSDDAITAQLPHNARAFKYPHLDKVYIMETDLYGNVMPKDSCFLAFYGRNGLMGKHLKIETLKNASVEDIKAIVQKNCEG